MCACTEGCFAYLYTGINEVTSLLWNLIFLFFFFRSLKITYAIHLALARLDLDKSVVELYYKIKLYFMNEVKRTMLVLCIIYLVLCLAALSAYLVLCIFHLVLCSEVLSALTIMLSCYSGTDTFVMSFIGESITIYG